MKIVVFDLDETLGYFTQFGIFWDSLTHYISSKTSQDKKLSQTDFNETLDLYPEFLRPNIINILNYLKLKKKSNCCHKMMIYTNNTGPREWAHYIIGYFESKIRSKLVDQIIAAFKINGKRVEICRSSHDKSHKDFIKCTKIPIDAEICFIDDSFYPEMTHDNIYYINIKPYYYDLEFDDMMTKFKGSALYKKLVHNNEDAENFDKIMTDCIQQYKYDTVKKNKAEIEVENVLGKRIITHLQSFFSKSNKNKTIRNRGKHKRLNKTLKRT